MVEDLVQWTSRALQTGEYHPLLVTASFVAQLHLIHPFKEGNGRLCRLLGTWMLMHAGYSYMPFLSMERILEESRSRYYRALTLASGLLVDDPAGLADWIQFFLKALTAHRDELSRKISREKRHETLPELSSRLMVLARQTGRLTMTEAVDSTQANRNTIKVHLRRLVSMGVLVRHGGGRGTWYSPV